VQRSSGDLGLVLQALVLHRELPGQPQTVAPQLPDGPAGSGSISALISIDTAPLTPQPQLDAFSLLALVAAPHEGPQRSIDPSAIFQLLKLMGSCAASRSKSTLQCIDLDVLGVERASS